MPGLPLSERGAGRYHAFGRLIDFVRAVDTLALAELAGPALIAAGLRAPIVVVHLRVGGAAAAPAVPSAVPSAHAVGSAEGRPGPKKGKGASTPDSFEGQAAARQRKAERAAKRAVGGPVPH